MICVLSNVLPDRDQNQRKGEIGMSLDCGPYMSYSSVIYISKRARRESEGGAKGLWGPKGTSTLSLPSSYLSDDGQTALDYPLLRNKNRDFHPISSLSSVI